MKITIQTSNIVNRFGPEAGYRMIRECGFEGIDWSIDADWNWIIKEILQGRYQTCLMEGPVDGILKHYEAELREIRKNGLEISQMHALHPSRVAGHPELDEIINRIYIAHIEFCQAVGCRYLVIHGVSKLPDGSDMTDEEEFEANIRLYSALIPALNKCDVKVCLENLLWVPMPEGPQKGVIATCSVEEDAIRLIDALNAMSEKENFVLCYDAGHRNLVSGDQSGYVRTLGKRIQALHLHDNDGKYDLHTMPYTGNVNWEDLLDGLRSIGYEGNLSFETYQQYKIDSMMPELVPEFLKTIATTGRAFRNRILNHRD